MTRDLDLRLFVSSEYHHVCVLHDTSLIGWCVLRDFAEVLSGFKLLDFDCEGESGELLLDFGSHEEGWAAGQDLVVLIFPAFLLSAFDEGLDLSTSCGAADELQVLVIACEVVTVEFLEDLFGFVQELFEVKFRVILLHFFDSEGLSSL